MIAWAFLPSGEFTSSTWAQLTFAWLEGVSSLMQILGSGNQLSDYDLCHHKHVLTSDLGKHLHASVWLWTLVMQKIYDRYGMHTWRRGHVFLLGTVVVFHRHRLNWKDNIINKNGNLSLYNIHTEVTLKKKLVKY